MWKSGNKIFTVIIMGSCIIIGIVMVLASMGIDPLGIQAAGNSADELLFLGTIFIIGSFLVLGGFLILTYSQDRWNVSNNVFFVINLGSIIIIGILIILTRIGIGLIGSKGFAITSTEVLFIEIIIIVMLSLVLGGILMGMYSQYKRIAFLFQNGIQGTAILKDFKKTGILDYNNVPQFRMKLEITLPDRPQYDIIYKKCLNVFIILIIKKDMKINVYVHPDKPKNIVLDWDTISGYKHPGF
ncbi:hypothetical protein KAU33_02200 [Candidatus Dependentiae bacterium]|nr:hypothetical protein [Candidatus Dependentiae bacterium]